MRTFHIIIGVDGALDKITLLKALLYPADDFFKLISIWKWAPPPSPRWYGLEFSQRETEIKLIDGKEHFINDIHTAVTPDNYVEDVNDALNFLDRQIHSESSLDAHFYGVIPVEEIEILR
ncbi:MAG: hypothetical protein ACE5PV_27505 [Candidatus Poribacteria bacterium]